MTSILLADFDGGDDVGFDAAHQMDLHPFVLLSYHALFVIRPADKARGGEPRGIHGKIDFDHFER
jgi:hypothetical protein